MAAPVEADTVPPPPPHLSRLPTDVPDPLAAVNARYRRSGLASLFRRSTASSTPSKSTDLQPPRNRDEDENSDAHSSASSDGPGFRSRLASRLRRAGTTTGDAPDDAPAAIAVADSRSKDLEAENAQLQKDLYRWAVMVENQRGVTLFGLNRYSSTSLLPNDPPPFTIPPEFAYDKDSSLTTHTLDDYQLPDASWVWVSRHWLVQMSGNGGSVDGFEYNWWFKKSGWRPAPGTLSTAGWVRRRQWVRLMMRPAQPLNNDVAQDEEESDTPEPSTPYSPFPDPFTWSDNPDENWLRAHVVLRDLQTDGRRIAMWREWLALPEQHSHEVSAEAKEVPHSPVAAGETATSHPSLLARQHRDAAITMLREKLSDVLMLFIFPESRHAFKELLASLHVPVDIEPALEFYSNSNYSASLL
ncbi:hypothetical protein DL93DRAFT_2084624 [Clavulina sp. PMI_390]|nr:hypothetical protein DL93DRAFT_2084624 [Clavulina sp. PMI_390]